MSKDREPPPPDAGVRAIRPLPCGCYEVEATGMPPDTYVLDVDPDCEKHYPQVKALLDRKPDPWNE
jgi:hypothetical protein